MVLHNLSRLIFSPYTAMRKIVQESDYGQVGVIFGLVYLYFLYANIIRERTLHPFIISKSALTSFTVFLVTFFLVTSFFYIVGKMLSLKNLKYRKLVFSFAYSVFPALLWFIATSTLYFLLPPPRTISIPGKMFALVFSTYSISLFLWRFILLYLSVRFSLKTTFFKTIAIIALFFIWFIPYSFVMYQLKIFRIPFI